MMFKSKHSGWTWDLKRTPFGGGGSWNPVNIVSDAVSSVSDALASVDPGPAIGSGLAQVDKAVNNTIPGGWVTVGGLALGGAALAYAPEVMALADSAGIAPETAAVQLGIPPVDAATGATVPLSDLGVSSGTGLTGGAGGSTGILTGGSTSGLTIPTTSAITVDPSIMAASGANLPVAGTTSTGAAMGAGLSGTSGLNPALPAAGANAGAGTGLSASLPANTVLGTGLEGGGAIGASYQLGANGLPATDALGNAISGSSVGLNGSTATSSGLSSSDLANLLKSSATSGAQTALQQLAKKNPSFELVQAVRGNQNPFVFTPQQPIQDTKMAKLAKLLQQG